MSRIRTIKPEFWTSDQVAECSPIARLLFIGMWNFCDDGGVHPASIARLKMEIFPADSFTKEDVRRMVDELIKNNLIEEYEIENEIFWKVKGWKHQKIDQPTFKFPQPNGDIPSTPNRRRMFAEHSENEGRTFSDNSVNVHDGRERKGRECKGKEGKGEIHLRGDEKISSSAPQPDEPVVRTFPVDGTHENFLVMQSDLEKWQKLYPSLDVQNELTRMWAWLDANPTKRKTRTGMPKFIVNWLNKSQNQGGRNNSAGRNFTGETEVERTRRLIREATSDA